MAAPSFRDRLARLFRRRRRRERIDPFTVHDPWRRFVQEALQARSRFAVTVGRAPAGPLRDRLQEIEDRIDTGVVETWHIAQRGDHLVAARRQIDVAALDRRLAGLDVPPSPTAARGAVDESGIGTAAAADAVARSLRSQREAAARMDGVIDRTESELRVLDARLDEAVARALELTARAGADESSVTGLRHDVDALVTEMEALRLALDEADEADAVARPGGGSPGPRPRGGPT